jgi:NO-binding membrane sensor protein with MHYT domain/nitrogen-specific signal transduction histidine kinase
VAQHYNAWLVALSVAVAILASYTTLDVALRVRESSGRSLRYWLIGGSLALGLGIWSMHFIGMLAHTLPVPIGYDLSLTLLSILPAVAATGLALELIRRGINTRLTVLMGGAIIGAGIIAMHYAGMAALRMSPPIHYAPSLYTLSWLIAIAAAIIALAVGLRLQAHDRWLLSKKLIAAAVLGLAIAGMHYAGMAAAQFAPGSISLAIESGLKEETLAVFVGLGSFMVLTIALLITTFDARLASEHAAARVRLEAEVKARTAELEQRSEELRRSNADLEQFAYIASHDLKEPLRTITSFAQLIERGAGAALDEQHRKYLGRITDSTQHMRRLIDELLTFSRLGATQVPAEPVDLEVLLARVSSQLTGVIEESGAQITHDPLPTISGWPGLLEHLFLNLLSNAVKFRAPQRQPQIHISARASAKEWEFKLSDNGIGIEAHHLERIFTMFQRLHGQGQYSGTGVGLAVCRKVVQYHGGHIFAESTPGTGTTFCFTLARAPAHATPEAAGCPAQKDLRTDLQPGKPPGKLA